MDSSQCTVAHSLAETECVHPWVFEFVVGPYRKAGLEQGYAMPVPFSELVSQHTFYRIPFQRTDRLLFIAEKPEVLVRIHIIITNLECQVVGNGNVVYMKREIIFLILPPHCIINGLVLVVQGLLIAGEA